MELDQSRTQYKKKFNLLGDGAVGKTSLIAQYVAGKFDHLYTKTIGSNVLSKTIGFPGAEVDMQIWDIMGQEGYNVVKKTGFLNSDGALAVCDVTRKETLESLENWIKMYEETAGKKPILIAVNKSDLPKTDWTISKQDLEKLVSNSTSIDFFHTSAKTGDGVNNAFEYLAETALTAPTEMTSEIISAIEIIKKRKYATPRDVIDGAFAAFFEYSQQGNMRELILRKATQELGLDIETPTEQDAIKLLNILQERAEKLINSEDVQAFKYLIGSIRGKYLIGSLEEHGK